MTKTQAINIARRSMPEGQIQKVAEYRDWYLLMIFTDDPLEGRMDPFYSVDKKTGEFQGFPYMLPEYFSDVMKLFNQ